MTPPLSPRTLAYGDDMARALLGLDALYRAESGDRDGLAVLNMDTEGRLSPEGFGSYAEARERFGELEAGASALPETDRQVYYRDLCGSTLAFMEWREGRLPFQEQLARFLHVPAAPASEVELELLVEEIHDTLGGMGYRGDLRARCAAWEERNRVPADSVPKLLQALLDEAWDRAHATLLPIPAEKSDGMRPRGVSGVAFNARCDYLGRTIEINTDPILTLPALKHLAVHEGYGGHYVQFRIREDRVARGLAPADNLLSLVNSASSCVFEGIADASMEMMGWSDGGNDRVQGLLNRHRAGIGTQAAWRLHALGQSRDAVAARLREAALAGGEGWVSNRMAFISHPARAVLIWSYWWGEPVVARAWQQAPPEGRTAFLESLYGRMHSNRSLGGTA